MIESGSAHGVTLASIDAREGVVIESLAHTYSGSPMRLKRHIGCARVISELVESGLLVRDHLPGGQEIVRHRTITSIDESTRRRKARLIIERLLLSAIREWVGRAGIVSYNAVLTREEGMPKVGQFGWDLCGPSYMLPLASYSKGEPPKPGFFVLDIILGRELSELHVEYFIRKCATHTSSGKQRPIVAMIVGDYFSESAFNQLRAKGILAVTPAIFFGKRAADALRDSINLLSNAAMAATQNPERILSLLDKVSEIEGAAANLRGPLFEMIAGHILNETKPGTIEINRMVADPRNGKYVEIDVMISDTANVLFCECKGKEPGGVVTSSEVSDWLSRQVPRIRSWALKHPDHQSSTHTFELWTTGQFDAPALQALNSAKEKTKKYSIGWMASEQIRASCKAAKLKSLVELLDEHFGCHPLTSVSGNPTG